MKVRHLSLAAAVAAALLFATANIYAADAPATDRGFTVQLPPGFGDFVAQSQTTPSPDGPIQVTNWVSKASATGEAVVVTVSHLPKPVLDPKKLIDNAQASLLKSVNGTVESEEPRTESPASVRLLFKSPQAFFRARLTAIADRYYQLLYVGRTAEQRSAPAVGQLFDSFAITTPITTSTTTTTTITSTTTSTTGATTTTAPPAPVPPPQR